MHTPPKTRGISRGRRRQHLRPSAFLVPAAHAGLVGIDWAVPTGWPGCRLRLVPERSRVAPIGCPSEPSEVDSNRQSPCLYTLTELEMHSCSPRQAGLTTMYAIGGSQTARAAEPISSLPLRALTPSLPWRLPWDCYLQDGITSVVHAGVLRLVLKDGSVAGVGAFLSVEASALANNHRGQRACNIISSPSSPFLSRLLGLVRGRPLFDFDSCDR